MKTEKQIINQITRLRKQLEAIQSPKRLKENQKVVGKCFKYHNSYGTGDKWWLYAKIISADDSGVQAFQFQDTGGRMGVEKKFHMYPHMAGYQPITEGEFYIAWDTFKKGMVAPF